MGNIKRATQIMIDIANDPAHGYNQDTRTGGIDFDCSSLVTYALNQAGFNITFGLTTHNMLQPLKSIGYKEVALNAACNIGDIFLNVEHHVCMVVSLNPVKVAEATHDENGGYHGGQPGDQLQTTPAGVEDNIGEIHIRELYTYYAGWDYHLQYSTPLKNWIYGNRYLSLAEMQNNAEIIYDYMIKKGWSVKAICGMLGNMQAESTINPALWENRDPYNGGYGLVQWTPYTKLSNWASDWQTNHTRQLDRIEYERANGLQWVADRGNSEGMQTMTFDTYIVSELGADILARYWMYKYEYPAERPQPQREANALYWFEYFEGYIPPVPPTPTERQKLKPWLMWYTINRNK